MMVTTQTSGGDDLYLSEWKLATQAVGIFVCLATEARFLRALPNLPDQRAELESVVHNIHMCCALGGEDSASFTGC